MSTAPDAKVAVVLVPRERYSLTETSLEHLYAFTPEPFFAYVVTGGCDASILKRLKRWEEKKSNLKIISEKRFLYPYEAKNIVLKVIPDEIEWLVFIDNDVKVSPYWLSSLLKAAAETGARIVHPLYLIEQNGHVSIHMADGKLVRLKKNGCEWVQPVMNYVGQNITEAQKFGRKESGFLEFHGFMVHRDVLRRMGDFDDLVLGEDLNFCFRAKEMKERVVFEPRSVITYVAGPPFEKLDLPYFKHRWIYKKGEESIQRMHAKYPEILGTYWDVKLKWLHYHRARIEPWFPMAARYKQAAIHSKTLRWIGKQIPGIKAML